eukprot:TRINITY_DN10016_c0_g1_i1.p1 TRINITY_DN10016_c0_g1~~TRINITY_DN10016_c0_g1_i1.p1  ORF type:complete len:253 (-),score=46.42 TRINITY_DN10016_c0_g1_i1:33-791(-)
MDSLPCDIWIAFLQLMEFGDIVKLQSLSKTTLQIFTKFDLWRKLVKMVFQEDCDSIVAKKRFYYNDCGCIMNESVAKVSQWDHGRSVRHLGPDWIEIEARSKVRLFEKLSYFEIEVQDSSDVNGIGVVFVGLINDESHNLRNDGWSYSVYEGDCRSNRSYQKFSRQKCVIPERIGVLVKIDDNYKKFSMGIYKNGKSLGIMLKDVSIPSEQKLIPTIYLAFANDQISLRFPAQIPNWNEQAKQQPYVDSDED